MKPFSESFIQKKPPEVHPSMTFPTPTSPEFHEVHPMKYGDLEKEEENKGVPHADVPEGGDREVEDFGAIDSRGLEEPNRGNATQEEEVFGEFESTFNLAETFIFHESTTGGFVDRNTHDILSDEENSPEEEQNAHPDFSSDVKVYGNELDDYANERILLLQALTESGDAQEQYIHPAWIDVRELQALEMSIGFSNHPDVFDLSDVATDSSLEIFLDEEEYNARIAELFSQSERSDSVSSEIPRAIYYLQLLGRAIAFFDKLRQAILALWVVKLLTKALQKLRVFEHLAQLGTKARSFFSLLRGPVDACVNALALTIPTVDAFISNFQHKPYLGIKGLRPTTSKIRLKSPASALLGVKRNTLKSMASRARLLRQRGAGEERLSALNAKVVGIRGFPKMDKSGLRSGRKKGERDLF